jgi:probable HAF family extracellular repeat protein
VVGFSELEPGSSQVHGFLWVRGSGLLDLGTLGGANSIANSINDRQEIVGVAENANGRGRAYLRTGGRLRSLGTLGGPYSEATDINDATQVVGLSDIGPREGPFHAFIWTAERGMEDLGTLGGPASIAFGISETGAVVGGSETANGCGALASWEAGSARRTRSTATGGWSAKA